MAQLYDKSGADPGRPTGKAVAVLGYGSQGRAHSLSRRASGSRHTTGS